jgi:sugar/nucleoside kinase (ribokinase family)
MSILAIGDAVVDLVCEEPVDRLAAAHAFVPHPGGSVANTAVVATSLGARVALAGGAGADDWGVWLRHQFETRGVDLSWFSLVEGVHTPLVFITVDQEGEPTYSIYGQDAGTIVAALQGRVDDAVAACDALLISSNSLVNMLECEITMTARRRALALQRPIVVDANIRPRRWSDTGRATDAVLQLVPGTFLFRCNRSESQMLTGEADPAAAAKALVAAGARYAVITCGSGGALIRGEGMALDVPGVSARAVDTTGAGDTFTAAMLARLACGAFEPEVLGDALTEAVQRSAHATEYFGAYPLDYTRLN